MLNQRIYSIQVFIRLLLVMTLALGSVTGVNAKPAWKNETDSDSSPKGNGKGKNKVSAAIQLESAPESQAVQEGDAVLFTVIASSTDGQAINYQWSRNGVSLNGETSASLAFNSVQVADAGSYSVRLSISGDSLTSSADLVVAALPEPSPEPEPTPDPLPEPEPEPEPVSDLVISSQPASAALYEGQSYQLTIGYQSSLEVAIQWRKDGQILAGETGSSLNLSALSDQDAGQYDVLLDDGVRVVQSAVAQLEVKILPSIELSWDHPVEREDGSYLPPEEIASYEVYLHYESMSEEVISIAGTQSMLVMDRMPLGVYRFEIATTDSEGITGQRSSAITVELN